MPEHIRKVISLYEDCQSIRRSTALPNAPSDGSSKRTAIILALLSNFLTAASPPSSISYIALNHDNLHSTKIPLREIRTPIKILNSSIHRANVRLHKYRSTNHRIRKRLNPTHLQFRRDDVSPDLLRHHGNACEKQNTCFAFLEICSASVSPKSCRGYRIAYFI